MCGIFGIIDFEEPVDRQRLHQMSRLLSHRGPDAEGIWHSEHAAIGCRRLAIVDVQGGSQPTSNEDGTIQVVLNGEIYNHSKLRRELAERGHRFRSNTDAEVLPHLYETVGLDFVHALDGEFGIALWDAKQQRLVLARDKVGVKPLFYHATGSRLVFASEIKGIFASGLCDIAVDPQGLSDCFFYGHPIAPGSFWQGVQDLPPGTLFHFRRSGRSCQTYFTPLARRDPDCPHINGRDAVKAFSSCFVDAVRKRLPNEVAAGVALSGGIDSSAVAAVATRFCNTTLPTSSIRMPENPYDESVMSRYVATELGLSNREIVVTGRRASELLPRALWHLESPFWFGAVATPFLELSRVARTDGFKVALTGDGADELLAGYDVYRVMKLNSVLASLRLSALQPAFWRGALKWRGLPTGLDKHIKRVHEHFSEYQRLYGEIPPWIYVWSAIGSTSRCLWSDGLPAPTILPRPPKQDSLRRQLYFEFVTRLPNWILVISDRLGMANGVEVRVPFLDHRLLELTAELAPEMILRRGVEKYVLREAVKDLLPRPIQRRRKKPFLTPIGPWYLGGPGRELAGDYLSSVSVRRFGLFDPKGTEGLWRRALGGSESWDTTVSEWICLMVLSTHILVDQYRTDRMTAPSH